MLVTADGNRRNLSVSWALALGTALGISFLGLLSPWFWLGLPLAAGVFHFWRYRTRRRLSLMGQPFPQAWEKTLLARVSFYRALGEEDRKRFRNAVKIFLDEVAITGIRTDVDDTVRVLVAASAVIPVLGFDNWEYAGLGEVLIYPSAYGEDFRTDGAVDRRTLGMVGDYHLSGVMILSKPDLIAGFDIDNDKRNVGIHEFSHLVDKADGAIDGMVGGTSREAATAWIRWVGEELRSTSDGKSHIDDYAYTNEAEYLAVLSEYFFESPEQLSKKDPKLYGLLQSIYRQDTKKLLFGVPARRRRVGRNDPCPCGSGEKYKRCCRQ